VVIPRYTRHKQAQMQCSIRQKGIKDTKEKTANQKNCPCPTVGIMLKYPQLTPLNHCYCCCHARLDSLWVVTHSCITLAKLLLTNIAQERTFPPQSSLTMANFDSILVLWESAPLKYAETCSSQTLCRQASDSFARKFLSVS